MTGTNEPTEANPEGSITCSVLIPYAITRSTIHESNIQKYRCPCNNFKQQEGQVVTISFWKAIGERFFFDAFPKMLLEPQKKYGENIRSLHLLRLARFTRF